MPVDLDEEVEEQKEDGELHIDQDHKPRSSAINSDSREQGSEQEPEQDNNGFGTGQTRQHEEEEQEYESDGMMMEMIVTKNTKNTKNTMRTM